MIGNDWEAWKRAKKQWVHRVKRNFGPGEFSGGILSAEGISLDIMKDHFDVPKNASAPQNNPDVDHGARRTVDEHGKSHAEHDAEKFFTSGSLKHRTAGFSLRRNRPKKDAMNYQNEAEENTEDDDVEIEFAAERAQKPKRGRKPKASSSSPPPAPKSSTSSASSSSSSSSSSSAAAASSVPDDDGSKFARHKIKRIGLKCKSGTFLLFRRRILSDYTKYRDLCPILCAEINQVNDKYDNPASYQPVGPKGELGPWKYFVMRHDLCRRNTMKFMLRKFNTRFHPAVIEEEKKTGIATWYMTKERLEELEKLPATKAWGHSRTCLDFSSSSEFVLLNDFAEFRSTNDLFQYIFARILKADPEIKMWYSNEVTKPTTNAEDDKDEKIREEAVMQHLALLEQEDEDDEEMGSDMGVASEEGDGCEDARFLRMAEHNIPHEIAGDVQNLLSEVTGGGSELALVPFSDKKDERPQIFASSSSSSSCSLRANNVQSVAKSNARGRPKKIHKTEINDSE